MLGVAATVAWLAVASCVILLLTQRLVGLRAHDADIEEGLDLAHHGEQASNA